MSCVLVKNYKNLPINEREVYRYLNAKKGETVVDELVKESLNETLGVLDFKVCYSEFNVIVNGNHIDFGFFKTQSNNLAKTLNSCEKVIVFTATIGLEIDRLLKKYSSVLPSKAVIIQAIGAERIETLCDTFCKDLKDEYSKKSYKLKPRFSPGYGDLSLTLQQEIFKVLDCSKKIGVALNNSLLISPSKSVTAIVGVIKG